MNESVLFSHSVVSNSLHPHGLQHARPPCPSSTPGVYSNSCLLSQWCQPTISSSVIPFSCFQSFPESGSSPMSQFFASGRQNIGVSASITVLPDPTGINLLGGQETLKSLLQHCGLKASVLQCSAFFMVPLSHPYMTTGKTIALIKWTFGLSKRN